MKGKAIMSCEPGQPSAKQRVQSTMECHGVTLISSTHFADSGSLRQVRAHACICGNLQTSTDQPQQRQTIKGKTKYC